MVATVLKAAESEVTRVDFLNSDTVQHLIGHYGYGAIFVIVMLESAGVPMPGETILVTAAVYAATTHTLLLAKAELEMARQQRR